MSEINYGCGDIGDHEILACGQEKKGGIPVIALLEHDHTITDFTVPSQWTSNIALGKVHLIGGPAANARQRRFKAEYPDPSPIETENPSACGSTNILDGFDHVVNFMDANVSQDNNVFYQNANGQSFQLVLFNCVDETITVVEQDVTATVTPANSPMSNKERRRYNGKLAWSSQADEFPVLLPAPAGIFN